MPTKARGPLQRDYVRLIRAAKYMGAKIVRLEIAGDTSVVIPLDDAYMEKLARFHPPAPDADSPELSEKREARDWKNW
jgi:hypothetical protein